MKVEFNQIQGQHGTSSPFGLGMILMFIMMGGSLGATQQNDNDGGEVAAGFLEINPSVRTAALGGHQGAMRGSLDAAFSNPAGMASLVGPEFLLTHNQSFLETKYNTIAFGGPAGRQILGISAQYIDDGSHKTSGVDAQGNPIQGVGEFRFSTLIVDLFWARSIYKKASVGITAKAWRESQGAHFSEGVAADVGFQIAAIPSSFDLGLVGRNLGPDVDGVSLPRSTAFAASAHIPFRGKGFKQISIFSDLDFASHRDLEIHAGIELQHPIFSLRAGYENLESDPEESLGQFSFGAGLRIKGWCLDYAWLPRGVMGDEHRVGVKIGFGNISQHKKGDK
jgi:hypothetical protein